MRTSEAMELSVLKRKVRIDLALQGVEPGFEQQALLLFQLQFDAQRVPHLERNAHHDGRAEPDQRLQPPLAGEQRKEAVRKGVGDPVADHLHGGDEDQHQNLAVDARLAQVAAHPAVEAQVDEGREGPDLLLLDKAAQQARRQSQRGVEGQGQKLVVKTAGAESTARPAWPTPAPAAGPAE
jgi:hypothetical protein